jgi:hypothetical protein
MAGAAAFLAMNNEVTALTQNAEWRSHPVSKLLKARVESLGQLRDDLLTGYASLLIGVLVARVLRGFYQRHKAGSGMF